MRRAFIGLLVVCAAVVAAAQTSDPRPAMTVGTAVAKRGEVAYGALRVPQGSDAATSIGIAVIHGTAPGKVVA